MLIKIYPENPNVRDIEKIVSCLDDDGVIIYPTDSVYAMGCSMKSKKAFERILRIKGIREKDANFSLICSDFSHLADFAKVDNVMFKLLKKNLPGPFTFILPASGRVPDKVLGKKKTVGIRIPDNTIPIEIVKQIDMPLFSTSLKSEDEILEYITDPELIHDEYENLVDIVVDGGYGGNVPTTIVDCTGGEVEITREGKGAFLL
ncbi:MAG: threonylcarbamoyl-AMP synthase [Prevotellaceae bacterium]|jgi:tRNA threonylcarbamoyl adenosine modification protein (Sua5/YciO/YrdC/YwlC family)|nr:threonylcarbamoyl-AMP synthase [Prevotellaceae bacterium]